MKRLLIFFLPFIVMLGAGCLKQHDDANNTFPVPTGTFAGQFTRIHYNAAQNKYDTLKANLTLNMDLTTGFKVTGDTAIVHAGSFGDFSLDPYYIQFVDKTYNGTGNKVHLSGTYMYGYNGSVFQIQATFADTLGFFYDLRKQ